MHGIVDSDVDPDPACPSPDPRHPALRASSFLLDFLYPAAARYSLRRLSPLPNDRLGACRPTASFAKVSPRLYSSGPPPTDQADTQDPVAASTQPGGTEQAVPTPQANPGGEPSQSSPAAANTSPKHIAHLKKFKSLLATNNHNQTDSLWSHYSSLDGPTRREYLGQTLLFLSRTGRVMDSWKISELFQQLDETEWDGKTFVAGLEAEINLSKMDMALSIFTRGLKKQELGQSSLVEAFDLIMAAALRMPPQSLLKDLWQHHEQMAARWDFAGITSQLRHVSSVAGLPRIVLGLESFLTGKQKPPGAQVLMKLLVRRALLSCKSNQVITLLRMTDDPLAYEEFICNSGYAKGRNMLVTQVYRIYRDLPESRPSPAALHETFNAYKSMLSRNTKLTGAELLWRDWHTYYEYPRRRAYQKHLALWASVGAKDKVFDMWKDYMERYADEKLLREDDTFTALLHVHAVRQELSLVQETFDGISGKFGVQPNIYCWNILLNAYAKAGDYEGAISTFEKMADALEPDRFSYGTLMQMSAARGDLAFTIDLYRRARRQRVPANDEAILTTLVEVYLQNDHFREAEQVCVRAAHRGVREPRMWNSVVHAYALRRDLPEINRVLTVMTELNIPYNEYTYQELLMGLALCRQSEHALHLLSVGIKENAFTVQEEHFHTVMGAFIKTGDPDVAARVHRLMQQCGFSESADSVVALSTAFNQWEPRRRSKGHSSRSLLIGALRRFYKHYGVHDVNQLRADMCETGPVVPSRLVRSSKEAYHFSRMVYIFTQLKDFVRVNELLEMFRKVAYGDRHSTQPLPIQMLNSVMWANLAEKNYDELEVTWKTMLDLAKQGSLSPDWNENAPQSRRVSPRYHYILSDGLKVMQTMYIDKGDAKSLQGIVDEVRTAGFLVDSKNWNLHVQGLAQLRAYREAFETCEQWLMPNWTGWFTARIRENMKNQVPLVIRQKGTSLRHLRPVAHTLYHLARAYSELDKMAPWSSEVSRMMRNIEKDFPRCHKAVTSMTRTGSEVEQEILEGTPEETDAEYEDSEFASLRSRLQALKEDEDAHLAHQ